MSKSPIRLPWFARWSGFTIVTAATLVITVALARLGVSLSGEGYLMWVSSQPIEMFIWRLGIYTMVSVFYLRYLRSRLLMSIKHDPDGGDFRAALLPRLVRVCIVAVIVFESLNLMQRMEVL